MIKSKIFYFILFFVFSIGNAQNLRVFYEYKYIPDSLDRTNVESELMAIDLTTRFSKFYSFQKYKSDSIVKAIAEKNISVTGEVNLNKQKENGKINWFVIKEYPKFNTEFVSRIGQTKYYVEQNLNFKWIIKEDKEKIENFPVQKAETDFGGRKWIAWFTTEIPIQDGPYKFSGLPGLILKIHDKTESHIFTLKGLKKLNDKDIEHVTKSNNFVFDFGTSKKINEKEYSKIFREFRKDPNKSIRQSLREVEEINVEGNMVNKNEYLKDREKRILDKQKKDNNLIEINLLKN